MIGIDAGNWFDRPPTGVAVYARNLIWELARSHPEVRFGWYFRSNRYFRSFRSPSPPNARRRLLEEFPLRLSAGRLELFHGLNQRLPDGVQAPRVATFHDLFALSGNYSTPEFKERFGRLARETANKADHIIAVSAHTANQVARRLGFPRSRISVVHHGVEMLDVPPPERCESMLRGLGVTRPFVLHMGTLQLRKNVERIVAAFEAAGGSAQLVLAGSHGYGADRILGRIDQSLFKDRIRLTGHVPGDVRACLYASAEVLLFPSLEEGFGLPVVEAFSVGLPVITSDASAAAEVAGDAAMLVDPRSIGEITNALERVLESRELRQELARKGSERVQEFTWKRCAARTWQVYRKLQGFSILGSRS